MITTYHHMMTMYHHIITNNDKLSSYNETTHHKAVMAFQILLVVHNFSQLKPLANTARFKSCAKISFYKV